MKEKSEIMGVNLNENDILIAHRLPPTKKVKDRLIVKFTRREKREEIYSKRKNLKSKRTKDLPSVVCEPESAVVSHKVQWKFNAIQKTTTGQNLTIQGRPQLQVYLDG